MKKLQTPLVLLMVISFTISACKDLSPAEKNFIFCTGTYFDQLAKCNAMLTQYKNEYNACLLKSKTTYDAALKKCPINPQEQLKQLQCSVAAEDTYLQNISDCTGQYNTNSAPAVKCQEEAYAAYKACVKENN